MILCLLGNTCVTGSTVQSESNRMEQLVGTITSTAGHEVRESSNSRISKGPAHKRLGQRSLSDGTEAKDGHLAVHDGRLVLWHRSTQSVLLQPNQGTSNNNPRAYRNSQSQARCILFIQAFRQSQGSPGYCMHADVSFWAVTSSCFAICFVVRMRRRAEERRLILPGLAKGLRTHIIASNEERRHSEEA